MTENIFTEEELAAMKKEAREKLVEELKQEMKKDVFEIKMQEKLSGTSKRFGYIRVSTEKQDYIRQEDMINTYQCDKVFFEKISTRVKVRPQLELMKEVLRAGDEVVVESFSRLARDVKDLLSIIEFFEQNDIKLISIKENFDLRTASGRLMLNVTAAFNQFERDLLRERTLEGLRSARKRGRNGGRKKTKASKLDLALTMYYSNNYTLKQIKEETGVSKSVLYREKDLREAKEKEKEEEESNT